MGSQPSKSKQSMTAAELITELQKLDPETVVHIHASYGYEAYLEVANHYPDVIIMTNDVLEH